MTDYGIMECSKHGILSNGGLDASTIWRLLRIPIPIIICLMLNGKHVSTAHSHDKVQLVPWTGCTIMLGRSDALSKVLKAYVKHAFLTLWGNIRSSSAISARSVALARPCRPCRHVVYPTPCLQAGPPNSCLNTPPLSLPRALSSKSHLHYQPPLKTPTS